MINDENSGTPNNEAPGSTAADKSTKETQYKKSASAKKNKLPSRNDIPAEYKTPLGELPLDDARVTAPAPAQVSASTIAGAVSSSEIQAPAKPNAISKAENPQRQKALDKTKEANKAEIQELVMRLFSPEIAREIAGAIAWVTYIIGGGLEISVWLIVEIVLEDADNLTKAHLHGHASARTKEEMHRKETAKVFSGMLARIAPPNPDCKLGIKPESLTVLRGLADRMEASMRTKIHVCVAFEYLWREGGNLAIRNWLLALGSHIEKKLKSNPLEIEKGADKL
jgi:hypothetical protein